MNKIKIAFINPPHADWCLPQLLTFLSMQSHYTRVGKFPTQVEWLESPYKWNTYANVQEVFKEIETADVFLFSSYIWNSSIVDELAALVKTQKPNAVNIIGGPQMGFMNPEHKRERWMYDYFAAPTMPGEVFITDFLDQYIDSGLPYAENITYEMRSDKSGSWEFKDFSLYEEHFDFLKKICSYADENSLEKYIVLETTRGCPYKCVYCEWGGGTGIKVIKKSLDIVKRDIVAIHKAGFRDVLSADANFGMFEERDREILLFAASTGIRLSDISVVKAKNLERRKKIVDMFYEAGIDWDVHIPIQSISEEAMRVSNRIDLSVKDKIELGKYIKKMAEEHGCARPGLELIMAMPGSTIKDFYDEYELLLDFNALGDYRYDYMVLPDSEAANHKYLIAHQIKLVDVYTDNMDEDNVLNKGALYSNRPQHFKTMSESFSYSNSEVCEMYFINYAAPKIIEKFWVTFKEDTSVAHFMSTAFKVIKELEEFGPLWEEIIDMFNPNTPARNINVLQGKLRTDAASEFIENYSTIIFTGLFTRIYASNI